MKFCASANIDACESTQESPFLTNLPSAYLVASKVEESPAAPEASLRETVSFDATKYADGKLVKKGDSWVDSHASMLADAQNFIKDRVSKMENVLVNLKAVRSRVGALKNLDKDLHAQIMADINAKHADLAKKIKKANDKAKNLSKLIFKAAGRLEMIQAKHKKVMASYEKKLEMKRIVLDKKQEDIRSLMSLMGRNRRNNMK
jgi:hypothetical protein